MSVEINLLYEIFGFTTLLLASPYTAGTSLPSELLKMNFI